MTKASWTKNAETLLEPRRNRTKFVVGGVVLMAAVVFLIVNAMNASTHL
jgi:hypothetical protein